ncbi:hypothetical protein GF359_10400 [candidate division WOR-3 bacterium]|uniref:Uncharacterized protein n=1 Tax=candidate division WOR-3 bacterium TaxID=2052148 RepID=A0A9D5KAV9_UNCW3|nr:hypothetical protein [candidate division WOR-3 bacterium]MBD3365611.1 hypothetical protein [candidate division WOR-3 bacterium]
MFVKVILPLSIVIVGLGLPIFYFWIWGIRYYFKNEKKGMALFTIVATPLFGFFIGVRAFLHYIHAPQSQPIVMKPPRVFKQSEYLKELESEFKNRGFVLDSRFKIPGFRKKPDLFARGKARTGFIPHHAYYFVYYFSSLASDAAWLRFAHKYAREYVNSLYKIPKVIRFVVPVINTVVITNRGIPRNHVHYIRTKTVPTPKERWTGGEINHIYLVDLRYSEVGSLKQMPSAGFAPILRSYDLLQSVLNRLIQKELARRV